MLLLLFDGHCPFLSNMERAVHNIVVRISIILWQNSRGSHLGDRATGCLFHRDIIVRFAALLEQLLHSPFIESFGQQMLFVFQISLVNLLPYVDVSIEGCLY